MSRIGFGKGHMRGGQDPSEYASSTGTALDAGIDWFDAASLKGHSVSESTVGVAIISRREEISVVNTLDINTTQVDSAHRAYRKMAILTNKLLHAKGLSRPPVARQATFRVFDPQAVCIGVTKNLEAYRDRSNRSFDSR